jgi:hypothetical protein
MPSIVACTRLNAVLPPQHETSIVTFATDAAGVHDVDGDLIPDVRVASTVAGPSGVVESRSYNFHSITCALLGVARRTVVSTRLESAVGDTDRDVSIDERDIAIVMDSLGAPTPSGPQDGDVTNDGNGRLV